MGGRNELRRGCCTGLAITMVDLKVMQTLLSAIGLSKKTISAQSATAFSTLVQTVKPTVFWEIGKTTGAYSWLALEHSKTCKTILFEANPDHYLALCQTIHHQQLHRADAKNIVVSAVRDHMPARVDAAAMAGALSRDRSYEPETIITVAGKGKALAAAREAIETVTLDELLARGYASPDMIKLEAQAAERLVMDGGRQVLEACSPILIVKTTSRELVRYLEGLSYRSFPFDRDNLIFVSVYF